MRTNLLVLLSILLGVGIGVGTALVRGKIAPWDQARDMGKPSPAAALPKPGEPTSKVKVDATEFDFGSMDFESKERHDFTFTNVGQAPLRLTAGPTSCRCTLSEVGEEEIPPGGSAKVTLTWKPAERPGPYQQTAKILTNDPIQQQVTLTISGKVTAALRFAPAELVFSQISVNEPTTATARLFCYLDPALKVVDHKWSDPTVGDHLNVAFEPLQPDGLKDEPLAKSGVLVRVTVKPGLPQGPVRQKLVVRTNLESPAEMTLPIQGMVASEIGIVGRGWDADTGTLTLGAIRSSVGLKTKLLLVVRGPLRKEVQFTPGAVHPALLKVSLGPAAEINNGAALQTPLILEIPPGSPTANHLGSDQGPLGEIIIETTHPQVPKLRILVRFAVEAVEEG